MANTGWLLDESSKCFFNSVPIISIKEYDDIAVYILHQYQPQSLKEAKPVNIFDIMEFDYKLKFLFRTIDLRGNYLGQTYFVNCGDTFLEIDEFGHYRPKTEAIDRQSVFIDVDLYEKMPERCRFTEAHELAHWVLHQKYFTQPDSTGRAARTESRGCTIYSTSMLEERSSMSTHDRVEWQANMLASSLLLPLPAIRLETARYFEEHSLRWKKIKNFEIPSNRELFIAYVNHIATVFNVSRTCALMRIERLSGFKYKTTT